MSAPVGASWLLEPVGSQTQFTGVDFTEDDLLYAKTAEDFVRTEVLPRLEEIESKREGVMVQLLKRENIRVVFTEETFPEAMLKVLRDEAGVKVYIITHIASGAYTADKFEREMQRNADTMIRALVTEA